jgi:hypothetical protein
LAGLLLEGTGGEWTEEALEIAAASKLRDYKVRQSIEYGAYQSLDLQGD